jgi:regulator of RNase E activity RraA
MNPDFNDAFGDRLEQCYSGAVYDTLRAMGRPDQLLPDTLRPLDPTRPLAGRIFTVSGHVDTSLDPHTTLLEWTRLLSRAPRGSVVICQPNDSTLAHMGELSLYCRRRLPGQHFHFAHGLPRLVSLLHAARRGGTLGGGRLW